MYLTPFLLYFAVKHIEKNNPIAPTDGPNTAENPAQRRIINNDIMTISSVNID